MTKPYHCITVDDFSTNSLTEILSLTDRIVERPFELRFSEPLLLVVSFAEPSTRTKASFLEAARRLGLHTIDDCQSHCLLDGYETLPDHLRTFRLMGANILVTRTSYELCPSVRTLADSIGLCLVNAGDGEHEHPTQALLDWYTLTRHVTNLEDRKIALVGDLRHHRSAHSLGCLISRMGISVNLVCPPNLAPTTEYLSTHNCVRTVSPLDTFGTWDYFDVISIYPFIPALSEVYLTLFADTWPEICNNYRITRSEVTYDSQLKILHPFPRHGELDVNLDGSSADLYSWQMRYGVPLRQALMWKLLWKS